MTRQGQLKEDNTPEEEDEEEEEEPLTTAFPSQ